jgi:hypothetical protein
VDAILTTVADDVLEEPCDDLLQRVRCAGALNRDETGWRTVGQPRAPWGAFTDRQAILRIAPDRHEDQARELLGDTNAIVTSDRWWATAICRYVAGSSAGGHLKRDFAAHAADIARDCGSGRTTVTSRSKRTLVTVSPNSGEPATTARVRGRRLWRGR